MKEAELVDFFFCFFRELSFLHQFVGWNQTWSVYDIYFYKAEETILDLGWVGTFAAHKDLTLAVVLGGSDIVAAGLFENTRVAGFFPSGFF